MAAPKPTKNPVISAKESRELCIAALKTYKFRVSDKAIRHLRLTMNATVASTSHLPEAIQVIFASLTERSKRRIELEDMRQWIAAPNPAADAASDGEAEWSTDEDQTAEMLHSVRKVLDRKRMDRKTYYLVDWEPTWEPREHVGQKTIAKFERERRALVRKTYIEHEAVEDNSLNKTER